LGRYTEAIQDYDQAITLNPKQALAYNNRGAAKYKTGRYFSGFMDYAYAYWLLPSAKWLLGGIVLAVIYHFKSKTIHRYFRRFLAFLAQIVRKIRQP
jgi:tetratricopeptide (TPR) repeat protein